ncbi:MAG: hypothetical protein WCC32_19535 [Terriglobales bacterium]
MYNSKLQKVYVKGFDLNPHPFNTLGRRTEGYAKSPAAPANPTYAQSGTHLIITAEIPEDIFPASPHPHAKTAVPDPRPFSGRSCSFGTNLPPVRALDA